jgi:hypothetical protein
MRLNLLTAVAIGTLAAAAAIPAAAAPLSPAGGQRDASNSPAAGFESVGQSQNLVIQGAGNAAPWVSTYEDIRQPLSPSGGQRDN